MESERTAERMEEARKKALAEGILRDRSMTPFVMAGDQYYDQVKAK